MADEQVSRRRLLKGAGVAGAVGLAAAVPMAALAPGAAFARSDDSSADPLVGAWRGPAAITFDPQGNPSGSGQVKSKNITLDEDVLHGPFTVTLFDTKGGGPLHRRGQPPDDAHRGRRTAS